MHTKFIIVCSDEIEAESNFAEFWERRSVDVLALIYHRNHDHIHLLTYFPYKDNDCENYESVHLAIWSPKSTFRVHLFPPKVRDFKKCPLYVTLLERPPSVFETENGEVAGVEVYLLHLVAEAMNATPIFQFLHKKKTVYRTRGNQLMLELTENHSHAVAGSLLMTTSVSYLSEGIEYSTSLCVTIAVPKLIKKSYFHIFRTLLTEKNLLIIACIIFGYISLFYFLYKISDKSLTFPKAAWIILSPVIGGTRSRVKNFIARTFFVSWLFVAFLLCKFFEASISSSVLAPETTKQLRDIYDVFRSPLMLRGENFLMREIVPRYLPKNHSAIIDYRPMHEGLAMEIITKNKNLAFLGSQMNLLYTFLSKKEYEEHIYIQEECLMRYSPVIQVRKNSPLYTVFKKYITALSETGIINHAFDTILRNFFKNNIIRKIKTDVPPLNLSQILGAFVVLVIGLLISSICFVTELVISYFKGRKSKVSKNQSKEEKSMKYHKI